MTDESSLDRRPQTDDTWQETRWEQFHTWGEKRASEAVKLVTVALLLLITPGANLFIDRLASVGIGLGIVNFIGLLVLAAGLLLCFAAGSAQLLGIMGHRLQ